MKRQHAKGIHVRYYEVRRFTRTRTGSSQHYYEDQDDGEGYNLEGMFDSWKDMFNNTGYQREGVSGYRTQFGWDSDVGPVSRAHYVPARDDRNF